MSETGELTRMVRADRLPAEPMTVEASEEEREALAQRFGLAAIERLEARLGFEPDGNAVAAKGTLAASFTQECAVSGEPFANRIEEAIAMRFVPESGMAEVSPDEEIELDADELDDIPYTGDSFDVGEAIAQSFVLALDPYAEGPGADEARREAGIASDDAPRGALADALAALKRD